MKYSLICYASSNYRSPAEAIENSGNWFIANFEQENLNITHFFDDESVIRKLQIAANNVLDVFGRVEDASYFVTAEDKNEVLFYETANDTNNVEWVEGKPLSTFQVEVILHLRVTQTFPVEATSTAEAANVAQKLGSEHFPEAIALYGDIEYTVNSVQKSEEGA